jgi:hypothetical protein
VTGILIAVLTAPSGSGNGGEEPTPVGSDGSAAIKPVDPHLKEAQDALFSDPVHAIEIIESNKATLGSNADAQMVLAQAHMLRHETAKALASYRKVLELSPSEANETLRTSLRTLSGDRNNEVAIGALDLWFGNTADTVAARDAIVKAAVSLSLERRHMARALVEKYKLGDSVDWLTVYTYDLEQEPTCERRKEAVEKLRALRNPKAIHVLELAVAKRLVKKNACLLLDARAGIAELTPPPEGPGVGSAGSAAAGSGSAGSGT